MTECVGQITTEVIDYGKLDDEYFASEFDENAKVKGIFYCDLCGLNWEEKPPSQARMMNIATKRALSYAREARKFYCLKNGMVQ